MLDGLGWSRVSAVASFVMLLSACTRADSDPSRAAETYVRTVFEAGGSATHLEYPSPSDAMRAGSKTALPTRKGKLTNARVLALSSRGPGESQELARGAFTWRDGSETFSNVVFVDIRVELAWADGSRGSTTVSLTRRDGEWLVVRS